MSDSPYDRNQIQGSRPLSSDPVRQYGREYGRLQVLHQTIRRDTVENADIDQLTDRIARRSNLGSEDETTSDNGSFISQLRAYLGLYTNRGVERLREAGEAVPLIALGGGLLVFEGITFERPSPIRTALYGVVIAGAALSGSDPVECQIEAIETIIASIADGPEAMEEFRDAMRDEVRRRVHRLKHALEQSE